MIADFQQHKATFLLYPMRKDVWRDNAVPAQRTVIELVKLIAEFESVYLGFNSDICSTVADIKNVVKMELPYNDIWCRDTGMIPLENNRYCVFNFNAWGGVDGLYSDWTDDCKFPHVAIDFIGKSFTQCGVTVEGGNLTTDGQGTLIAVKPCIVNANRNPQFTEQEIEEQIKSVLNVEKIIWLENGIVYDETGGHVDNICTFVAPGVVFLAWTDDPDNPQYGAVHKAFDVLRSTSDAKGRGLDIVRIPLPPLYYRTDDDCIGLVTVDGSKPRYSEEPIQASYINFLFVNGGVIVPQFGAETDSAVLRIFTQFFTDRIIRTFDAREIILGGGGLHCITRNI